MKKMQGQLEMDLPELDRPRWRVRGYLPDGEKLSGLFDDKNDAEYFKNQLEYVCLFSGIKARFQVEQDKK